MRRWIKNIINELKEESIRDILIAVICLILVVPSGLIGLVGMITNNLRIVYVSTIGALVSSISLAIVFISNRNKKAGIIFTLLAIKFLEIMLRNF